MLLLIVCNFQEQLSKKTSLLSDAGLELEQLKHELMLAKRLLDEKEDDVQRITNDWNSSQRELQVCYCFIFVSSSI